MKVIALIGDTKRQSRYRRAQIPHSSPEPTLHTSNSSYTSPTPHPPRTRHTQTADPALIPHTSTHPAHTTPHTSNTAHSSYTPCIHPADPTLTLHPSHTPRRLRIHTTYLANRADPTSISHTHTPDPALTTHTPPALSPRAPQTPRPPRPLAAELQPLPAESESAPPGGAGGRRRLRCASPTRDSVGGSSSSRGRGRELLATLRGPRSPSPPARSLSPAPRVAGDPRDPHPGPCRRPRPLPATAFLSTHRSPPSSPSAALDRKLTAQPRPPTPTPPRPPPAI